MRFGNFLIFNADFRTVPDIPSGVRRGSLQDCISYIWVIYSYGFPADPATFWYEM